MNTVWWTKFHGVGACGLLAFALGLAVFLPGCAEPPSSPSAAVITQGRQFFLQSCSSCHGAEARGDEGPDLHNLPLSDDRITVIIKNGIKGEMPAFGKKYPDPDITVLAAYVRSLQ